VKAALSNIRLFSRIIIPAAVHEIDDIRNRTKPQPDIARLSAMRTAPATPKIVPTHLSKLNIEGIT
jgi:hypothetical protein